MRDFSTLRSVDKQSRSNVVPDPLLYLYTLYNTYITHIVNPQLHYTFTRRTVVEEK